MDKALVQSLRAPLAPAVDMPAESPARSYEPPTLTGKKALEEVTLFSFGCTPGAPNCNVGHP